MINRANKRLLNKKLKGKPEESRWTKLKERLDRKTYFKHCDYSAAYESDGAKLPFEYNEIEQLISEDVIYCSDDGVYRSCKTDKIVLEVPEEDLLNYSPDPRWNIREGKVVFYSRPVDRNLKLVQWKDHLIAQEFGFEEACKRNEWILKVPESR